ncbi:hypothetical protein BDA96_08G081700 [Sorghum bicolor]|uniref:Uncharacterized protein n=1 Tax=Sorghum bicolor TaxID=4558 RepID=A0A921U7C1_SORBI|nr:hypothetical protein BDA96_08G081700 [Sorghum bicolor]
MSSRAIAWLLALFVVLALIVSGAPHDMSTASSPRRALAEAGPLGCCSGGRVAGSQQQRCPRQKCPPPRGR